MPGVAVIGLQWGDEAKGKVVDILTDQNDIVVRYQGGANAGHTVVFDGEKYKLSLIPSGIFRSEVQSVIAGGVVIDPKSLFDEIDSLVGRGIKIDNNLMISDRAHLIFPWHKIEDKILDSANGQESIGTTMRGIGPCYQDKVSRSLAIRVGDMFKSEFKRRVEYIAGMKKRRFDCLLRDLEKGDNLINLDVNIDTSQIIEEYSGFAERLRPYVCDTTNYLLDAVDENKRILFEGAQGSLLDIDHGTFPFVTSSNSSGVGISSGSGVPSRFINKIYGVVKAYSTRVGGGPFPTEQDNETGAMLRNRGKEYGTVTKRPRRCGWFDVVAVRYAARLSGVDAISLMLLDVLSGFDILQICTSYNINGRIYNHFPSQVEDLRLAIPNYETLPGWDEDISNIKNYEDLPSNAKYYIQRISELIEKKIEIISVGADRKQTIFINK
ncbi:MAG: adenylosuccinate synthase [Planctomycetaceae bacterium]|nr:adenylosuccinate synthase [Planctomycetaceae bacterium]